MSAHLTNQELTSRLLGEASLTVDAHLLDCAQCRKELHDLKESLSLFRSAAVGWSEHAAGARRAPTAPAPWSAFNRWALVAAALLLVMLPAIIGHHRGLQSTAAAAPATAPATQAQIDQDNELLSAVNSEIAEGVPAPMQPLQLGSSASADGSTNQAK